MRAVVQAILLDPEARGDVKTDPNYGKLREPAQYINNILRANNVKSFDKTSTSDGVLGNRSICRLHEHSGQRIFLPPTVFSYYQPGYEIPGTEDPGPGVWNSFDLDHTAPRKQRQHARLYGRERDNSYPTPTGPAEPHST